MPRQAVRLAADDVAGHALAQAGVVAQVLRVSGAHFDIKAFHQAVLGAGSLPLDLLETRVRAWIESESLKPGTMGV